MEPEGLTSARTVSAQGSGQDTAWSVTGMESGPGAFPWLPGERQVGFRWRMPWLTLVLGTVRTLDRGTQCFCPFPDKTTSQLRVALAPLWIMTRPPGDGWDFFCDEAVASLFWETGGDGGDGGGS